MVRKAVRSVAVRHGLRMVTMFGSQARGGATPDSDVDLCVVGGGDPVALTNDFSRAFGRRADVVMFEEAGPLLRFEAVFRGELLFGDRGEFELLRLRVLKEWQDMTKIDEAVERSLARHL